MRKKSIDHWEALKQDFITNPDNAVKLVRELSRQGNELEDRLRELEAENADLKNQLRDALERC